ncbi:hypothetical protein OH77DRAFT_639906 [Trametes cingulata]|nr:hypothetical protein OH77DRAFT_639906 [Trametes cingulata]
MPHKTRSNEDIYRRALHRAFVEATPPNMSRSLLGLPESLSIRRDLDIMYSRKECPANYRPRSADGRRCARIALVCTLHSTEKPISARTDADAFFTGYKASCSVSRLLHAFALFPWVAVLNHPPLLARTSDTSSEEDGRMVCLLGTYKPGSY